MAKVSNIDHVRIGHIIKRLREKKCLTQDQLATTIGCHQSTLAGYESGNRPIPEYHIAPLSVHLGIDARIIDHRTKDEPGPTSNHHLAEEETYVYRLFNADGELIYIGCTHDVEARLYSHKVVMWWFPQYVTKSVEAFSNRAAAHAVEREAIFNENPKWNIRHRSLGWPWWTEQMYLDFIKAIERSSEVLHAPAKRRIAKAKSLLTELRSEIAA